MSSETAKWPNDIQPPVHYQNGQWAVTGYGMESLSTFYHFDAKRLLEKTSRSNETFYDWPVHLAEKDWVDIIAFIDAFKQALVIHQGRYAGAVDQSMLAASIREAQCIARECR